MLVKTTLARMEVPVTSSPTAATTTAHAYHTTQGTDVNLLLTHAWVSTAITVAHVSRRQPWAGIVPLPPVGVQLGSLADTVKKLTTVLSLLAVQVPPIV